MNLLLRVNKQIYDESTHILHGRFTFHFEDAYLADDHIPISPTVWPSAVEI